MAAWLVTRAMELQFTGDTARKWVRRFLKAGIEGLSECVARLQHSVGRA